MVNKRFGRSILSRVLPDLEHYRYSKNAWKEMFECNAPQTMKSCHECWFDKTGFEGKANCPIHSDKAQHCPHYSKDEPDERRKEQFRWMLDGVKIEKKNW